MKRNLHQKIALSLLTLLFTTITVFGQVTTSSLSGAITDTKGESLPGASVVALHTPSGTTYSAVSNLQGRYNIQGMRVGGPYLITFKYLGFEDQVVKDVTLTLGVGSSINAKLSDRATQLNEVVVTVGKSNVISSDRTGASTSISNRQIEAMPTVSRGFNDFVKLSPQADVKGTSISIGGINNRFNQVTIDGAVSNDVFGLSGTGTNGGSTNTSPISLDAIDQFQVQIAPFDIRAGGFAGGGIAAVTRSGDNNFAGSAYFFTRNENLAGKTPGSLVTTASPDRVKYDNFKDKQYGFRLSGPIVKNKLFFFVNAERTSNTSPLGFAPGAGSNITISEAQLVADRALALGYDPGSFGAQQTENLSKKIFAKIDWNINAKNKAVFRHSFTEGEAIDFSRTANTLTFSNGAILRKSATNSSVFELNSVIGANMANNLVLGYTRVREPRTAPGAEFPRVAIDLGTNRTINLGTEAFSTVNQLNQDIFTLTDNFTISKDAHTFTFGTHNELYSLYNAFIGQGFGDYKFASIADFQNGLATSFNYQYSNTSNPKEGADFNAMQLGAYLQDEFQASQNFKITGGIRFDIPIYLDKPTANPNFNNSVVAKQYGVEVGTMPKPALMFSPRVGFNWDVKGDKSLQLRGGTGLFTSRFPFVWAGGAFTQNGILLDRNSATSPLPTVGTINFVADPNGQPKRASASGPGGNLTVIDNKFKLPQIFRTNIGLDKTLPFGIIGTFDVMYSKNINTFKFTNLNLVNPTTTLGGADNRVLYPSSSAARRVLPAYTEIINITNVNEGDSYSASAQLQKTFSKGLYASISYTYTRSNDLNPGTSSQNQSNYYRVANANGSNNLKVGFSPFDTRSRIVGLVSYKIDYLKHGSSTFSLFYNGQSGTPFSYVYNGDVNREALSGSDSYDLVYIPKNASEIVFVQNGTLTPAQQWDAFNAFVEATPYLKDRRGKYAERNGARTPFTNQFDFKFIQDIYTTVGGKKNTIQLSLDILNAGNLLNKNWGRQYSYGQSYFDNTFRLLRLRGYDANNVPNFTFDPIKDNEPYFTSDNPIGGSRWVAQIGLRYIFN